MHPWILTGLRVVQFLSLAGVAGAQTPIVKPLAGAGSIDPPECAVETAAVLSARAGDRLAVCAGAEAGIGGATGLALDLRLVVEHARPTPLGIVLDGVIEGVSARDEGRFSLAVAGGQVSASFHTPAGNFGLAPTGRHEPGEAGGRPVCVVERRAPGEAVRCAMQDDRSLIAPSDRGLLARYLARQTGGDFPVLPHRPGAGERLETPEGVPPPSGACACGDDGSVIDVMFACTTLAKNAAGGASAVIARIDDALAACNSAYTQSAISMGTAHNRLMVRSAGFYEFSYDEVAPAWLTHLDRLADIDDGFLDGVIAQRDAIGADVVCLIVDDTRFTGGAAFYALYVRDAAAQVLNWRAMGAGSLTFAHELGHTFGCAHDRGNSTFALFPYAWGHSFSSGGTSYGTIMSSTGSVLVPVFSNPMLTHATGQPLGVGLDQPLPSHNALAISQARWAIAAHGDSGQIIDCNGNGIDDAIDINQGSAADANGNCRPDSCERRVYVDAGNTGPQDGSSWNTAYTSLAQAMIAASLECSNISEIWIADGAYTPDVEPGDRFGRFELRSGLAIYGSFQGQSRPGGGETSIAQRVFAIPNGPMFPTVLTGAIGSPADEDNSFNVLFAVATNATAILDGCIIEKGYQDFGGAGIYIENASPTIRNCIFRNLRAGDGAGAMIIGSGSSPTFIGCTFRDNAATSAGGCIVVRDFGEATFQGCVFRDSTASFGGAVNLFNGASASLSTCSFTDNDAAINSGAIDAFTDCTLFIQGCTFRGNRAGTGGGGSGGAMIAHTGCSATISGCTFVDNAAPGTGGALWADASTLAISNSTFTFNTCGDGGGALSAFNGSSVTISDTTISGNQGRWGGAANIAGSALHASRCTFHDNHAVEFSGGALDLFDLGPSSLSSCAFTANSAADAGGAVSVGFSPALSVVNCTLASNAGANFGGGISMFDSSLALSNSIVFANTGGAGQSTQDQQLTRFSGTAGVNASCIAGLTGSLGGTGNIGANPMLADPLNGDVRLSPGSACIDAGSNAFLVPGHDADLLMAPRRADDPGTPDTGLGSAPIVDIGAIEFVADVNPCPPDFNMDGNLDPDDLGDFINCYFGVPPCDGADFNQDGNVDPDDLGDFINAYFSGC
ncbi:MAG: M12 family metallo-peptidase [Phycisphaerales bacterium]